MTESTPAPARRLPWPRLVAGLVALALVIAGVIFWPKLKALGTTGAPPLQPPAPRGAASATPAAPRLAQVTTLDVATTVEAAGSVSAVQTGAVVWKTSGNVTRVNVKAGDPVKTGDVLMTLDPLSAPQTVIAAQADLIAAQRALDDLLNPPALNVAQAQKNVEKAQDALDDLLSPPALNVAQAEQAVAKARDALDRAQTNLNNLQRPDLKYYRDQVQRTQDALTNAQQNTALTDIGQLQVNLRNAQKALETATNVYNNARDGFKDCPSCEKVWAYDRMTSWTDAQNLYTDAVNLVQQIQTSIDQAQRGNALSITAAQDALDKAQQRLDAALATPDAILLGVDEAAVKVAAAAVADAQDKLAKLVSGNATDIALARAMLADAQDKLTRLQHGADPRDVATARARLAAAQATVNGLTLTAPFDGDVLVVNNLPGDAVTAGTPALLLADRSVLRVDAQVDETDIGRIAVGASVSVTLEALPDTTIAGKVTWINPNGAMLQGLVKYTVRVELTRPDPRVLLGMTARAAILVDRQSQALAVPLAAVQTGPQGDFVRRVRAGSTETVPVARGQRQGGLVVVTGDLEPGDQVLVASGR